MGGQKVDLRASAERSNGGGAIGRVGLIVLEYIEFALGRSATTSASFEEHVASDSDEHGVSDVAPLVDELIGGSESSGASVSATGCVALFVFGRLALVNAVVGVLGSSASGPALGWAAHIP